MENNKLPQIGTKEFNDMASAYFGGAPKQNKMTAVEWLLEKYKSQNTLLFADDFNQAKEMENEQRKESFDNGYANGQMDLITD